MSLSGFVRSWWWLLPLGAVLLVWLIIQCRRPDGAVRRWWDRLVLKLPAFRTVVLYGNIARFARTMSILMRSGVHLLNTVSISTRVISNTAIRASLEEVAGELRQGQKISKALSGSSYVPPMMLRMIAVGEETGEVEAMLDRIAERYESDLRRMIKRMLSLLEP
jgi:type II secretory pathway component PulF